MLERQELGSSVSVSGVALRCRQLTSLLRALKLQTSVQQLCLSGTGLADDSAEELLATSRTMPKLKLLNLSANHLGPEGMRKLAEGLSGTVAFQVGTRGGQWGLMGVGLSRLFPWRTGQTFSST